MGQYKVPQNVEAEDKILGPLTFRQFIYAIIGVVWGLLCFGVFHKIPVVMVALGFPPVVLFMLLAFYNRDGQNFEQFLIALVGFFAAPHHRLWVKEEIAETFHIEPTKHLAEATQRDSTEVRGELEKLATLIDSRGWNKRPEPDVIQILPATSHEDRIVPPPRAPHAPDEPKSDMLDLKRSPLAQNLAELLNEAARDVREEAMSQMTGKPVRRGAATPALSISGVTPAGPGDILKLATESDGLTVSQIAAQATRIAPAAAGPVVDGRTNGHN